MLLQGRKAAALVLSRSDRKVTPISNPTGVAYTPKWIFIALRDRTPEAMAAEPEVVEPTMIERPVRLPAVQATARLLLERGNEAPLHASTPSITELSRRASSRNELPRRNVSGS
jgi:hypothetical protein